MEPSNEGTGTKFERWPQVVKLLIVLSVLSAYLVLSLQWIAAAVTL